MRFAVARYQTAKNQEENPTVLSLTKGGLKVKADLSFGKSTENYVGHQIVKRGQFVFTPRDFDATPILCGVAETDGCISNLYIVFDVSPHISSRFLEYYFWGLKYGFEFFEKLSFGMRYSFNRTQFENIPLLYPDLNTQEAVVNFLDQETARIDHLIEKKQRLVTLFGVKRSAVISNATVKGLNPNVEMKDTGIKWLGEVPAHWKVMPIKYLATRSLIDGPHVTPTKCDDGVPFISAESIKNGRINFEKKWGHISEDDHKLYSRRYKPQRGDIFVVKLGATTGRVARVETDDDFNIWVPLAAIRPKSEAISKQIYYALQSNQVNDAYQVLWTYGTQQTLGLGTLSNLRLPVPPEPEMEEIARYLEGRLPKIESAIELTEQSIEHLKEYRSALITAAVTGQIDVGTWGKSGQTDRRLDQIEEDMALREARA
jgi:type I restriction enzyme S subunit